MSRKYKFHNPEEMYFVSFAVVYWVDAFVRDEYCKQLIKSLDYCRRNLGMEIFCYCIMPSHVHLIFRAKDNNPASLLGKLKEFTSKRLIKAIEENPVESRREWLLWMMERAASKSSNVSKRQFWQHHNKPIELWSSDVIDQKVEYIHKNPVEAGFVDEAEQWRYSSSRDYSGMKGLLEIDFID